MEIINNIIQTFKDEPLSCTIGTIILVGSIWFLIEVYKAPIIDDEH
jgi:hypothetical protein